MPVQIGERRQADANSSLQNALEDFRHSGPRHTADEEESLFSRMSSDHDELGSRWLGLLYARHIGVEDREVFPVAGRALNEEHLASIGKEMAERRRS